MIVYKIIDLFGVRKRSCKRRVSDKNKRLYSKKFRRLWFWQEDRWNQRHELNQKM